jgi:hypothetical protein
MIESCFQLKWNCTTGVCPLGAQVRTRVGRSLKPDSSTNTISLPSAQLFFKARPLALLPPHDRLLVALQRASLRLLAGEPQSPKNAPHVHFAKANSMQPFNEQPHTFDRPQLCTKAMCCGAVEQRAANLFELLFVQ